MKKSLLSSILVMIFLHPVFSQISISGQPCANPGSTATYTISGNWTQNTAMTWSVTGGTFSGGSSGTPKPQVTVIWNSNYTTGTVSLSTSNPSGSANLTVTPGPALAGGTISNPSQSINFSSTPAAINCPVPTGGACSPSYTYQWQQSSSSGGTYSNVASANGTTTSQNLTFNAGVLLTATTFYKRLTTETTTNHTAFSTIATVTVFPQLNPGNITPATITISFGTSPGQLSGSLPTGGNGTYGYRWFSSLDANSWSLIGSALSQNYTPPTLTNTTYYYREVTSNGVTLNTPSVQVTVSAAVYGVTAPTNSTGSANSDMNWSKKTTFDASGNIIGQSKSFYDKTARLIQSQDKVFYRKDASTVYTHVFASQPLRDAEGKEAVVTKPAPIDYADFSYISNFVQAADATNYNYKNFDRFNPSGTETDKTNSPDQVGSQAIKGTLGWYYGPNNNWEAYLPTTNYPYARMAFYRDGTNSVKKKGTTGEAFVMGSGHEVSAYVSPVIGEFTHYIQVRNKYFTSAQVGNLASNLLHNAVIAVDKDANGNESFTMTDRGGKVLMRARPGTDITLNSSAGISAAGAGYGAFIQGTDHLYVTPSSTQITVTVGGSTFYQGPASGFNIASLGAQWGGVSCAQTFTYQNCPGGVCSTLTYAAPPASIFYLKILANNTSVSITGGGYTLYDMNTELPTSLINGNSLNKGYYKVLATSGNVSISYSNSFTDVSYNFYNQLGQLVATIAPEGVKRIYVNGINFYATLSAVPFVTTYQYDSRGRLVSNSDPDKGTGTAVYRLDGKIRFSQSALQATNGSYSYTNYDQYGRPIEIGQYLPDAGGIVYNSAGMTSILENTGTAGDVTTGTKTDVVKTVYDLPDNTHNQAGYVQDPANLGGTVSTTLKYSTIVNNLPSVANLVSQTWFSYDEEGKVVWKIRYIAALGTSGYKTTDYSYDAMSRVTKKVYQKNVSAETFVHYYQYDPANGNLWKIFTNTVDNPSTEILQANMIYYLHGALKRVELATNLQGIDYAYTLQGSLKSINNSNKNQDPGSDGANGFSADAFGLVLDYFTGDYTNTRSGVQSIIGVNASAVTGDSYTGNVKALTWYSEKPVSTGASDAPLTNVYKYDPKYQFIESVWGTGLNFSVNPASFTVTSNNKESVKNPSTGVPGYDGNGNILYLQRTNSTGAITDQFAYNYNANNNQLQSVVNTASGTVTYGTYSYNQKGQLTSEVTSDPTNIQKYIQYDLSGKILKIAKDAAFSQMIVSFVYDETGKRIIKNSYNSSSVLVQVTYYTEDAVYTQPVTGGTTFGAVTPQEFQIIGPTGRLGLYYRPSNIYAYQLTDHLGNIRAVVAQSGSTCQVRMYSDFYPFGMVIPSNTGGTNDYRYGYQGENAEADGETSWNAFEVRMYNPRIGRWMSADPEGEFWSAYEAMGNDPLSKTDESGGCTDCPNQAKAFAEKTGGNLSQNKSGDYTVSYVNSAGDFTLTTFIPGFVGSHWVENPSVWEGVPKEELLKGAGEQLRYGVGEENLFKHPRVRWWSGTSEMTGELLGPAHELAVFATARANGHLSTLPDPTTLSSMIVLPMEIEGSNLMVQRAIKESGEIHSVEKLRSILGHAASLETVNYRGAYVSDAQLKQINMQGYLDVDALQYKDIGFDDRYPHENDTHYNNFILFNSTGYKIITLPLLKW